MGRPGLPPAQRAREGEADPGVFSHLEAESRRGKWGRKGVPARPGAGTSAGGRPGPLLTEAGGSPAAPERRRSPWRRRRASATAPLPAGASATTARVETG